MRQVVRVEERIPFKGLSRKKPVDRVRCSNLGLGGMVVATLGYGPDVAIDCDIHWLRLLLM